MMNDRKLAWVQAVRGVRPDGTQTKTLADMTLAVAEALNPNKPKPNLRCAMLRMGHGSSNHPSPSTITPITPASYRKIYWIQKQITAPFQWFAPQNISTVTLSFTCLQFLNVCWWHYRATPAGRGLSPVPVSGNMGTVWRWLLVRPNNLTSRLRLLPQLYEWQ